MALRTKTLRLSGRGLDVRLRTIGEWGERPLEDLRHACRAAGAVDKLIRQTVARARESGCTWAEIGQALGISRQAAWERFSGEE